MANELKFGSKVVFLNGNPLTLPILVSDPGSAVAGDMYYNSTSNKIRYYNGSAWADVSAGAGTVTSVALADGSTTPIFSISGSPVSTSGTLTQTLINQSANQVFAGPSTGSAAQPGFRALVAADVPTLNQNTTGTASNITASSNSTLTTLSALSLPGSQVTGDIAGNAANITASSNSTLTTLSALSLPGSQVTGDIAGNAANVNGTVAIGHGGTGQVTAPLAFAALSPLTTAGDIIYENATPAPARLAIGSTGQVLTVVGGLPAWASAAAGTVTSVALVDSTGLFTVTGSPVTSSGSLTLSAFASQAQNAVLAGPSTGGAGAASFRALAAADIPSLSGIYLPLAGGTMTGAINLGGFAPTNSGTPVNPNDLVPKSYVDNFINATSWKNAVLVATTANITLSGEQTIDGFLTSSSRVLVKNQSTASQNGIYVSASGAWSRASDMAAWSQVPAAAVFVEEGTVNADLGWVCTSQPGGTIGTTAINFVQFSSAGAYSADGTTLQLISGVFSIKNGGVGPAQLGSVADGITLDQSGSGSTLEVKTGGITNTQVSGSAAIAYSKLNLSGSITNSDITALANIAYSKLNLAASIINADISASAAISYSKLASLTSANILLGNVSNVATPTAVTGDITINNTGVTAVAKIAGTTVSGTTGSGNVVFSASPTLSGTITAAAANFSGALGANGGITSSGSLLLNANAGASAINFESSSFGRSTDGSNFVTETYVDSTTLTDNSGPTAVAAFQFSVASFAGLEIAYVIETGTSNVDTRIGTLRITANSSGTIVPSLSDMYSESADCGITWTATNTAGTISVKYTASNQGANRTMRADVKSLRR